MPYEKDVTPRISPTALDCIKKCERLYYYRFVSGIAVPTDISMAFGTGMHQFVYRFYRNDYKSPDSFARQWSDYWFKAGRGEIERIGEMHVSNVSNEEEGTDIFMGYWKIGQGILKRFYNEHRGDKKIFKKSRESLLEALNLYGLTGKKKREALRDLERLSLLWHRTSCMADANDLDISGLDIAKDVAEALTEFQERGSHLKLWMSPILEYRISFNLNGIDVIGVVDRIEVEDNKIGIIDYKTTKKCPYEYDPFFIDGTRSQFTAYDLGLRRLTGHPANEENKDTQNKQKYMQECYYYHLRSLETVPRVITEEDTRYFIDDIEGVRPLITDVARAKAILMESERVSKKRESMTEKAEERVRRYAEKIMKKGDFFEAFQGELLEGTISRKREEEYKKIEDSLAEIAEADIMWAQDVLSPESFRRRQSQYNCRRCEYKGPCLGEFEKETRRSYAERLGIPENALYEELERNKKRLIDKWAEAVESMEEERESKTDYLNIDL